MTEAAASENQIDKTAKSAGIIIRMTPNSKDELYHCLDGFEMARKKRLGLIGKSHSYQKLIEAILKAFQKDAQLPLADQKICPLVADSLNGKG